MDELLRPGLRLFFRPDPRRDVPKRAVGDMSLLQQDRFPPDGDDDRRPVLPDVAGLFDEEGVPRLDAPDLLLEPELFPRTGEEGKAPFLHLLQAVPVER